MPELDNLDIRPVLKVKFFGCRYVLQGYIYILNHQSAAANMPTITQLKMHNYW